MKALFFDIRYELKNATKAPAVESPHKKAWEGEAAQAPGYKPGRCVPRVWENIIGNRTVFAPGFCIEDLNFCFPRHALTSRSEAITLAKLLASEADTLDESDLSG